MTPVSGGSETSTGPFAYQGHDRQGVLAGLYAAAVAACAASERQDDGEHGRPIAFHGQPVHPLPPGETYAGIVVPTTGMGLDYQLFLPAAKVEAAVAYHAQICAAFLQSPGSARER